MTNDQLGKALVSSGLLPIAEVKSLWAAIPAEQRPKDAKSFAELLIEQGKLTKFQATELLSGTNTPLILGDYQLLAKIGAGGMGQVFKAQHRHMKRTVAIKLLPADLTKDEAAIKRFQREVEAAAKLSHPNIVQAYDASTQRGVWYLVMEFVEGRDLAGIVAAEGSLPIPRAVNFIRQSARGLGFAHENGVVHRDIKPANLLLDKKGTVKILDMGLARFDDGAAQEGLTQSGQVMGTVDYMAPEQAFDTRHADARADVYSLGCTLFRLLTAQNMYEGESLVQKLMGHQSKPIPKLTKFRPDVSPKLEAIFERMVAKDPQERYQTMAEVMQALAPFEEGGKPDDGGGLTAHFEGIGTGPGTNAALLAEPTAAHLAVGEVMPTISLNNPLESTDPVSARSIQIARENKPRPLNRAKKPPIWKQPLVLIVGGVGGLLITLLSIWVIIKDKDGKEVARVQVPEGGNVEVNDGQGKKQVPKAIVTTSNAPKSNTLELSGQQNQLVVDPIPLDATGEFTIEGTFVPSKESAAYSFFNFRVPISLGFAADAYKNQVLYAIADFPNDRVFVNTGVSMQSLEGKTARAALTWSAKGFQVFLDGKKLCDQPINKRFDTPITMLSIAPGMKGIVREVRCSKGVRYTKDYKPESALTADKDTIALYRFDEGTGDVLRDSSGNNHHGKIVGAKWVKVDGTATLQAASGARPSGGYALRTPQPGGLAAGQGITIPTLKLPARGPYTVETYFTPLDKEYGRLYWIAYQLNLELDTESKLNIFAKGRTASGKDNQSPRGTATFPLVPGQSYHIAAVRTKDESQFQLYVDGKLAASCEAIILGNDPFVFGTIAGEFDEFRVSKVARYEKDFTPATRFEPDADTLALYHMDEGTGDTLNDSSGNNYHGKIVGAKWVKVAAATPPANAVVYLDDLQEVESNVWGGNGLGKHGKYRGQGTTKDTVIIFRGQPVAHSLWMHPPHSEIHVGFARYQLEGRYTTFVAEAGVSENSNSHPQSPIVFRVLGDGRELWKSSPLQKRGESAEVSVDIRGVKELRLESACEDSNGNCHAVWFMPRLTPVGAATTPNSAGGIYLDDLPEVEWKGHLLLGKHNLEYNGWKFTWRGQEPAHSLSTHPKSNDKAIVRYRLNTQYSTFSADVGLADQVQDTSLTPLTFRVLGDGRELWKSQPMKKLSDTAVCAISVAGIKELQLEVDCPGDNYKAHGVWFMPRLTPVAATPSSGSTRGNQPSQIERLLSPDYEWSEPESLGPVVNAAKWNGSPTLSDDQLCLIVMHAFGGGEKRSGLHEYRRKSIAEPWSAVKQLSDSNQDYPSLDSAGLILLSKNEGAKLADGKSNRELVVRTRASRDAPWGPVTPLATLNTVGTEDSPVISPDGLTLVFSSNRPGSLGGNDLWISRRADLQAGWETPVNLGSNVNSVKGERASQILADSKTILFSRNGELFLAVPAAQGIYDLRPVPLPTNIKISKCWLSPDGATLYFASGYSSDSDQEQGAGEIRVIRRVPKKGTAASSVTMPVGPAPALAKAPFDAAQAGAHQEAWAKHLGVKVETPTSVGGTMVLIPPSDDVAKPFLIGKYEVTQAEWEKVMGYNPSEFVTKNARVNGLETSKFPVETVSWFDSVEFCNRLSEQEGLKPYYDSKVTKRGGKDSKQIEEAEVMILGGSGYHLPTDVEWMHSCLAGSKTRYHFGDKENDMPSYAWFKDNSDNRTHGVGGKTPNAFGLHDMHGNVKEWNEEMLSNATTTAPERAMRGGAWYDPAGNCRGNFQPTGGPAFRFGLNGLRLARSASSEIRTTPPLAKAPFDAAQAKAQQEAWAKYLGIELETTNSVGAKMVLIPPGEFLMGSSDADITLALKIAEETKLDPDGVQRIQEERPQHLVRITKPFRLGIHEVTIGQFRKFIEQSGYKTQAEEYGGTSAKTTTQEPSSNPANMNLNWRTPGLQVGENFPVIQVSWNDAAMFCNWLSVQEKLPPSYVRDGNSWTLVDDPHGYRLPTEAEWEYACRAGTTTQFSFGDDFGRLDGYGWYKKNSDNKPHPVGTKLPNGFGLYDMHGNVWEWCHDWYSSKWYERSPTDDPRGPLQSVERVARESWWGFEQASSRSSSRDGTPPAYRGRGGFRVALSGEAVQAAAKTLSTIPAASPANAEFLPLFNGRDLTGWTQSTGSAGGWKVVDGVLTASGPESYLVTERKDFEDFHLQAEAKINDGGNGGIYFRVAKEPAGSSRPEGFEAQIDSTHKDPQRTGGLYNLVKINEQLVPPETWFTLEVIATGPQIKILVNGKQTVDYTNTAKKWTRGPLALQHFGDPTRVSFRKLEIKLPSGKTPGVTPQPAASSRKLWMHDPAFSQWIKDVQALPAAQQIEAVSKKLMELNPGFDGVLLGRDKKGAPTIQDGVVKILNFDPLFVIDLSPLRGFAGLVDLNCGGMGTRGRVQDLSPLAGLPLTSLSVYVTSVNDLTPLRGMSITYLNCGDIPITDLQPLTGMPVRQLFIPATKVSDLSPLAGAPLQLLNCEKTLVADLSPLEKCRDLTSLNVKGTKVTAAGVAALQAKLPNCKIEWDDPAKLAKAWDTPTFQQWMKDVAALPADKQLEAVSKKFIELNPRFDGTITGLGNHGVPKIENGVVTECSLYCDNVTDISPIRALAGLTKFGCVGSKSKAKFSDLSPLQGMKLSVLECYNTQVRDLSALSDMEVTKLLLGNTDISDLSPLESCLKLNYIYARSTRTTAAAVANLKAKLPNCNIEWDDPAKRSSSATPTMP